MKADKLMEDLERIHDEGIALHAEQIELDKDLKDVEALQLVELKLLSIYKQKKALCQQMLQMEEGKNSHADIQIILEKAKMFEDAFSDVTRTNAQHLAKLANQDAEDFATWVKRSIQSLGMKAAQTMIH